MSQAKDEGPPPPTGIFFIPALALISLIGPLAVHLYLPAIPAVKAALGLTDAEAQFTFSISLFCMSFATLAYGALSDRYGRRPLLLSGLCLFLVGTLIAGAAPSAMLLVAGRSLQAIGAGCGTALARTIASDVYGHRRLIKAIAYLSMFYTLGPMISPMVGGILVDLVGWRGVFGFALLLGSAILASSFFAVPETRRAVPAGPPNLFRNYCGLIFDIRFAPYVLQGGFNTGTFLVLASAASTLMKELLERPATEYGVYFLLFPIGLLSGSFIASRLSGKVSNETMTLSGSLLSCTAVVVQAIFLSLDRVSPLVLFLPGFFITLAQGMSLPFGQAAAMGVNRKLAGMAAGIGVFVQMFGGAVFAQLYGFVANGTPGPMMLTMLITGALSVGVGVIPFWRARAV